MPIKIQRSNKEAHEFLKKHKVGVLATVDPNGEPHAAAIYYTTDSDMHISFLTKTLTKKADNLRHNNHAMFVVYDAASQSTVQIAGTVSEIDDLLEANRVFTQVIYASLDTSDTDLPPIAHLDRGAYVAFRLTPKQVHMAVYSHPKSDNYNSIFSVLESTKT